MEWIINLELEKFHQLTIYHIPLPNLIQAPYKVAYKQPREHLLCTGISTPDIGKHQLFKSPQKQHPVTTIWKDIF